MKDRGNTKDSFVTDNSLKEEEERNKQKISLSGKLINLDPPIEMIYIKEEENNNHNALDRND